MSRLLLIMLIVATLSSCASSKNTISTSGNGLSKENVPTSGDGLSFETAVVAKSVDSEYEWIKANYPGSRVQSQALVPKNGKKYDVLTVQLSDGSTKKLHFNIDSFFGKGF